MKIFLRILAILVLLLLMAVVFGLYFLYRTAPQEEGTVSLAGATDATEVYFDGFGIPHIYASNAADAYRAFGYVHAQDRLFQMELMRRVGHGRLAEVLGTELAGTDAFFRTLGTHRAADRDAARFATLPAEIQGLTQAYLHGVNAFIEKGNLPIEFTLLGYSPEPFTTADMYAIAGYMAYSFAYALRTDPIVEFISLELDSTYLHALDLALPANRGGDTASIAENAVGRPAIGILSGAELIDGLPVPTLQGSNAWAVAPARKAAGRGAMLANDTHIRYASPSVWYEAHLHYPGHELYGNFIAGIPFALSGHTRELGWGLTMFEDDDSDFFIQRFATPDSAATVYGETATRPVRKYQERIRIKDRPDSVFTVYDTENGPIINAFLPGGYPEPVAMYWNYTCIENSIVEAFHAMNHAKGLADFEKAVPLIGSPGLNVTYADVEGNIATWACSQLIDRAAHTDGKTFMRGYDPEDAYRGYIDFSRNPQVINPESGFIVSANQYHDPSEGMDYPGYYAPNKRYDRLHELIGGTPSAGMDDMKRWITDVLSPAERDVAHDLMAALGTAADTLSDLEASALATVANWDGDHQLHSVGPALHYLWLYHTVHGAFSDELGDTLFDGLLTTHLFSRSYPKLIADADSPWWDDVSTPDRRESRQEVVAIAFRQSVKTLAAKLGNTPEDWTWERTHTLAHPHPLGAVNLLKPFFNVGPFPAPGGLETVNNAGFILNPDADNRAHYGPAMRILIDFDAVDEALSVLPTGNSGNVMSDHYKDQAQMYIDGRFRPMLMDREMIRKGKKMVIEAE